MPASWLPYEDALPLSRMELTSVLATPGLLWRWMDRGKAETDRRWKQPIPYILLQNRSGCIAIYHRRGTEERLHGLWSAGIGGHVEMEDEAGGLERTLMACAQRELAEEVPGCSARLRFRGVINEEVTEVGTVHWGLVFTASVAESPQPGEELMDFRWLAKEEAAGLNLERWSRLALRLL